MRKETRCTIQKYAPEWTKETKPKLAAHQPYGCLTSSNTALFDVNGGGGDLRLLAAVGQRVLVVAYTHSAVDTLLCKLSQPAEAAGAAARFLRIGRTARVHPLLQSFTAETVAKECTSCDQLTQLFNSYQVQ